MQDSIETTADISILVKEAEGFAARVSFDKKHFRHQILIGLYLSVIERSRAIALLLDNEMISAALPILRCIVETDVEIQVLNMRPAHIRSMELDHVKALKNSLIEARKRNPFMAQALTRIDVDNELRNLVKREKKLAGSGGKTIEIKEKFEIAGMSEFYRTVYKFLCRETHPSYAGIIAQNFALDLDKDDFEITLYTKPDAGMVSLICHTTCAVLKDMKSILDGQAIWRNSPSSTTI